MLPLSSLLPDVSSTHLQLPFVLHGYQPCWRHFGHCLPKSPPLAPGFFTHFLQFGRPAWPCCARAAALMQLPGLVGGFVGNLLGDVDGLTLGLVVGAAEGDDEGACVGLADTCGVRSQATVASPSQCTSLYDAAKHCWTQYPERLTRPQSGAGESDAHVAHRVAQSDGASRHLATAWSRKTSLYAFSTEAKVVLTRNCTSMRPLSGAT